MMAACNIFDEDEVCMPTSSTEYKYGLVVESSEYLSSDEEDDEDRVKRGEVKVCWHPSGDESVMPEKKLILADRSLMPGDVVRRLISGTDSQRGFVQDMSVKCHVKILGTDQFIQNVDAKHIMPIQEWDQEPEVTLDSWVGHILEVIEDITVSFQDGARCCLSNAGTLYLEDVNDKRQTYSEFAMKNFYPGQELRGNKLDYEEAKWLQTSKTRGPGKMGTKALYSAPVIVEKVEANRVDVRWICKGFTKTAENDVKLETPPTCVQGDKLKQMRQLDCFRHCHLQIGDKGYYTIKDGDSVKHTVHITPDILQYQPQNCLPDDADTVAAATGDAASLPTHILPTVNEDDREDNKPCEMEEEAEAEAVAADFADDEFEDVDDNKTVPPLELPSHGSRRKGRKRFSVGTRSAKMNRGKKAKPKSRLPEKEFKSGDKVPVEVCYTFSMCSVMWQDGSVEHQIPSPELFPIHYLDEMEFFPGDFVIDSKDSLKTDYGVVTSCDHKERTVMVKWIKPISKDGKPQKPEISGEEELSVYDVADHEDFKFRAGHTVIRVGGYENDAGDLEAVGQVHRLNPDGTLDVWWPSNKITQCYPQDLYIISEEFHSDLGSGDEWSDEGEEEEEEEEESGSEEGSDVSWETENETEEDSDTDEIKNNKNKQLWYMTDEKRRELIQLLKRVEEALSGLLDMLVCVPGSVLKNARQVFQDILHIYKKCKEMEKLLKSPYFSDDDMEEMIAEVKEQLKREKTAKIARHVAHVYRRRSGLPTLVSPTGETETEGENVRTAGSLGDTETCTAVSQEPTADGAMLTEGATANEVTGATCAALDSKVDMSLVNLQDTLAAYNKDINDPMFNIILVSAFDALIKQKEDQKPTQQNKNDKTEHDKSENDIMEEFQRLKQKLESNSSASIDKKTCDSHERNISSSVVENGVDISDMLASKNALSANEETDSSQEQQLTSSQRELCTVVLKALKLRLLYIQEDISRKWLAHQLGCDETTTVKNMCEKLQQKMIDSLESGNGPLNLTIDIDKVMELDKSEDGTKPEDGVKDLMQMEGSSTSSPGDETEDKLDSPIVEESPERFEMISETPDSHKFKSQEHKPDNPKTFNKALRKEMMLFRSSLPEGILVKAFEDRMDLLSVLIKGPADTPYEDGLFAFDVQLPSNFPGSPPVFHYVSFCSERLNPNLYEDGKVCVSLLGTWSGKGSEMWTEKSSLLQVLVSIQGLILVAEPYYNEAGYEKQRGTQQGQENSRMYNEMAMLKLVQSMTKMTVAPATVFEEETKRHIEATGQKMIDRIGSWISHQTGLAAHQVPSASSACGMTSDSETYVKPEFPLLPASKGFCITMRKYLKIFQDTLDSVIVKKKV